MRLKIKANICKKVNNFNVLYEAKFPIAKGKIKNINKTGLAA